jgi:LysR family transcriptional regulator, transcriptional activator of nhaA
MMPTVIVMGRTLADPPDQAIPMIGIDSSVLSKYECGVRHLNYTHLMYFWTVAREGSIVRAAEVLHLTPQTISGQLKLLEESIGRPLFHRVGRRLQLSESGRLVQEYADEIFSLGAELSRRVKSDQPGTAPSLNVGITNSIAKLIAYRIIEPALSSGESRRVICCEGDLVALLADLAVHRLDLVVSDQPIPAGLGVKAYNHVLGDSAIAFFAPTRLARRYADGFPHSLSGAPMLLPVAASALRRRLDDWFEAADVQPIVIAEFDDSALMKAFGQAGRGLFPAPQVIAAEIESMYRVRRIGEASSVMETYYAISPERRIKDAGVMAISESARFSLFGDIAADQ